MTEWQGRCLFSEDRLVLRKLGRLREKGRDTGDRDVPPGQFVTEKFPVLTFGATPNIDLDTWEFKDMGTRGARGDT